MSSVTFRNLVITPNDPVERWGVEGIETALERGGLEEWRRIASAVAREPFGEVAADLEQVLSYADPYGIGRVMRALLEQCRSGIRWQQ